MNDMKRIITEQYNIHNISVFTVYPEGLLAMPVVIYLHGYFGSRKQGLELGHRLAEQGIYFISFDAMDHGERQSIRVMDDARQVYPPDTGLDMWLHMIQVIQQSCKDTSLIIDYFENDPKADISRLGITGMSMGGYATYSILTQDDRVKAAVPMIGLPSFHKRFEDVWLESSTYSKWSDELCKSNEKTLEIMKNIADIDPEKRIKNFYPKPLLILVGDLDLDQPKKYSIDLYKELKSVYVQKADHLKLSVHDGVGHYVSESMMEEACQWFIKHL